MVGLVYRLGRQLLAALGTVARSDQALLAEASFDAGTQIGARLFVSRAPMQLAFLVVEVGLRKSAAPYAWALRPGSVRVAAVSGMVTFRVLR